MLGKTGADIASVGEYDSAEKYAEAQAKDASREASAGKMRMSVDKNEKLTISLWKILLAQQQHQN